MSDGAAVDTAFARTPAAVTARRLIGALVLAPLQRTFAPSRVEGLHHVEGLEGPAVFAAHHESHADTMVISRSLPPDRRRRLAVAAAADYFFPSPLVGRATALAFGAIPVERDRADRRALKESLALLDQGWSLVIYPEGGRCPAGQLRPFLPGAAWIARRAGVPVVPVHLEGTGVVLPKGSWWPRRSPVQVRFGAALRAGDAETARDLNARLESAVRSLAGRSAAEVGSHPAGDDPTTVPVGETPGR